MKFLIFGHCISSSLLINALDKLWQWVQYHHAMGWFSGSWILYLLFHEKPVLAWGLSISLWCCGILLTRELKGEYRRQLQQQEDLPMYATYRAVNDRADLPIQYPYYVTIEALHKMEFVLRQLEQFHPQWFEQRRWDSKAWALLPFEAFNTPDRQRWESWKAKMHWSDSEWNTLYEACLLAVAYEKWHHPRYLRALHRLAPDHAVGMLLHWIQGENAPGLLPQWLSWMTVQGLLCDETSLTTNEHSSLSLMVERWLLSQSQSVEVLSDFQDFSAVP